MKIRLGYVSNSSSSSFLTIGIDNASDLYKQILIQLGLRDHNNHGETIYDIVDKHLDQGDEFGSVKLNDNLHVYNAYSEDYPTIGLSDVIDRLEKGAKVSFLKKSFITELKHIFNIDVDEKDVHLVIGESSNES